MQMTNKHLKVIPQQLKEHRQNQYYADFLHQIKMDTRRNTAF